MIAPVVLGKADSGRYPVTFSAFSSASAVRRCAARWEAGGREAFAVLPRTGKDMNDAILLGGT